MASENIPPMSTIQQQPLAPHHAHNPLTQASQATLAATNHTRNVNMHADINAVWSHVDNAVVAIGEKYSKSVASVQQAIGSGTALSGQKHGKINPWCAYLHGITTECWEEGQLEGKSFLSCPALCLISVCH
jgi:hypothetical protein